MGMETEVTAIAPVEVTVAVVEVAPPGNVYETFVASPLTRKYPSKMGIMIATIPTTPRVSFGGA